MAIDDGESPVEGAFKEQEESPPPRQGTPRGSLHERVAEKRRKRVTFLPVPDLQEVVVAFKAVDDHTRQRIAERAQKNKRSSIGDPGQDASILADSCIGIFERMHDGELLNIDPEDREGARVEVQEDGDWKIIGQPLTFASPRFKELIGTEDFGTAETIKSLYVTDGDLMTVARSIFEFSGYSTEAMESEIQGN